jgi:CRISPR-associated protein Csb1
MDWIADKNAVAAVLTEYLEPVAGKNASFQPPTYADHGYVISGAVAVIDSVQSQANRLEAIFTEGEYTKLVPQILIKEEGGLTNLISIGHRLADAAVLYSSGSPIASAAFEAAQHEDFTQIAKVNPTVLLLGVWDSRRTGVKIQRALGFSVDASGVTSVLDRAAQYRASIDPKTKSMLQSHHGSNEDGSERKTRSKMSEEGFNDIPSFDEGKGGVIAKEIVRRGVLNLSALRKYAEPLRDYLVGLGLVMFTYPLNHDYRSGTLLVQDAARPMTMEVVYRDGKREPFMLTHQDALAYAQKAARVFGVGENREFVLNQATYKQFQKAEKMDRTEGKSETTEPKAAREKKSKAATVKA